MHAILGQKRQQTQRFLEDGTRVPVTMVRVDGNSVVMVKTQDTDGYWAVQLGYGIKKNPTKAILGHVKKGANLEKAPKFLKEVRLKVTSADELPKVGEIISADSVLKPGDIIDVTGTSKGKGFAGGVKRFHFKGGPRTHGQSDRERAPGSIGQTTTPGRVYRGKRMAGKMGFETVTVKNLEVIEVRDGVVYVKGLIPGILNAVVMLSKKGEKKNFVPLLKNEGEKTADEAKESQEQEVVAEAPIEQVVAEAEAKEEPKVEEPVVEEKVEEVKEDK